MTRASRSWMRWMCMASGAGLFLQPHAVHCLGASSDSPHSIARVQLSQATAAEHHDERRRPLLINEKLVHFVRHAEGEHNAAAAQSSRLAYLRSDLLDAELTAQGAQQCEQLRVRAHNLVQSAELVCVSPMTRTMNTALRSFPQLTGRVRWIALEDLRERTGLHPCDKRRKKSDYAIRFPEISFDELQEEEDPYFDKFLLREPEEHIMQRVQSFLQWLSLRPEREIVVVSHDGYLRTLFTKFLWFDELEHKEFQKFSNCELRTVALRFPKP